MTKFDPIAIGLEQGVPPTVVEPYAGTDRTVQMMKTLAAGSRGEQSLPLRFLVEDIIRFVDERDKLSQIGAIYCFFRRHYTFVPDPPKTELVKDPLRLTAEIVHTGKCLGDCDDASTWLLAAPRTIGIRTDLRRTSFHQRPLGGEKPLTHVLAGATDQHGRFIVMDPVADLNTKTMLGRVTRFV